MSTRLYVLIGLLLLVIGLAIGRYTTPEKVVTKTVIDTHTVTVVQHDTVTKIVKDPNGSVTTVITDKDVDTTHSATEDKTATTTIRDNPQWHVAADFSSSSPLPEYIYGVRVERRILGPIFIGAFGNANRQFGGSLGVEF